MKELTIEEKAQRYDKAIKEASIAHKDEDRHLKAVLERIFPTLKESEDEKIRKGLIRAFKSFNTIDVWNGIKRIAILEWLEKQGEQKPNPYTGTSFEYNGHIWDMCARDNGIEILFDGELKAFLSLEKSFIYPIHPQPYLAPKSALEAIKGEKVDNANKVEQKFKVGDYIISNNNSEIIYRITGTGITELGNPDYVCEHVGREKEYNGRIYTMRQDKVDANFRLWTIQDAKDGDIIYAKSKFGNDSYIRIFSKLENEECWAYCKVYSGDLKSWEFDNSKGFLLLDRSNFYPATKKQCDLLFQKMIDAGYEWDAEKKELRKIERDLTEFENTLADVCRGWIGEELGWKDYIIKNSFPLLELAKKQFDKYEQKSAWSKEDEYMIKNICNAFEKDSSQYIWLKSLRLQNRWKPSDAQMDSIACAVRKMKESACYDSELVSLHQDLKKLKEE